MAKVTSKLQVTIPKAMATHHGIEPGDEVVWTDAGDAIRLAPVEKRAAEGITVEDRLKWFDDATERQRRRKSATPRGCLAGSRPGMDAGGALQPRRHWLTSEDFQHDRVYGTVRVINPFHSPPDHGSAGATQTPSS